VFAVVRATQQQVDFSLYLSIATGLLATLAFVILAATHRRRRHRDYDDEDEEDAGSQACPECDEPIRGFEILCRACGHRFGPRFESRGHRR
jgi:hypothetical protein